MSFINDIIVNSGGFSKSKLEVYLSQNAFNCTASFLNFVLEGNTPSLIKQLNLSALSINLLKFINIRN